MDVSLWEVFVSEVLGTGMLILLGAGVVANVNLVKNKGFNGGWLLINFGWGLGVMAGVFVAFKSGGHINPAVTFGLIANDAGEFAPGVDITFGATLSYLGGQLLGAFLGAVVAYLAYRNHFEADPDDKKKLGVFSTAPEIRNYTWNFVTEVVGTFVLMMGVLTFGLTNEGLLAPLPVALLVVGIGASLGGPTGYAINPARDLGPRIAYALLPTNHKASAVTAAGGEVDTSPENVKNADWAYAWVPVAGPIVGAMLAGLLGQAVF